MSLHLIELPLNLSDLHGWAGKRGLGKGVFDEGLALHHLLNEVFGPALLHPFRLMVAPRATRATLYAYGPQPAEELIETARSVTLPTESAILDLGRLRSLPRPIETWHAGQRLGFDLRLRPVVRLASALNTEKAAFAKGAEVDAFLAETLRNDHARSREDVYLDWLAKRLSPAAELERETSHLHKFQRRVVVRGGKRIDGPDATILGTLTVQDPQGFADRLARGIGRHRAYGYGMLLLRPPQRRS
ncbi:type I-E CRISPR-associated protein Cas6/Cse3/CasE [Marinovum sp.]|uniref:type I-E CRISPR-associated protein Cas6/Cse3/CasE n=1 Tax=Marinovum sp. TaxID=2024839 RepID=UPI003A93A0A6